MLKAIGAGIFLVILWLGILFVTAFCLGFLIANILAPILSPAGIDIKFFHIDSYFGDFILAFIATYLFGQILIALKCKNCTSLSFFVLYLMLFVPVPVVFLTGFSEKQMDVSTVWFIPVVQAMLIYVLGQRPFMASKKIKYNEEQV